MGAANRGIFEFIAEQCAKRVPEALFIVVSNPVELAVHILAGKLDRRKIIGMGAQQDSLRFARAIAKDLGISRRDIRASVLGEHGQAMVPLWGTVELLARSPRSLDMLELLKQRSTDAPLRERVDALQAQARSLLESDQVAEAYEATRHALPDARIFVEPFITAHSMRSTPNATTNATLQCIAAVLANDRRRVHGQVLLQGEVLDLHGICGVPITLGRDGWHHETLDWLSSAERRAILDAAGSINKFILSVLRQSAEKEVLAN
jgi:malate dehydrogenase